MISNIPNINIQRNKVYADLKDSSVSVPVNSSNVQQVDSVHFTSKTQNENNSFLQKHWGKLLVGAGVIALGAVLTKGKLWDKPPSFEKVHQNLVEIFGKKNLSKEEVETTLKKYQEIYKIEDKNEYITKLFEQVKKDFGYGDNKYIYLTIKNAKVKLSEIFKHKGVGGFCQNTGEMNFQASLTKKQIFTSMFHEFTHVKQDEIAFRTIGAKEKRIAKYIEYFRQTSPDMYEKKP